MDLGKAIKLAIENVYKEGLTDIFVRPYEVDLLKNDLFTKDIAKEIKSRIEGNSLQSLKIRPLHHVLFPKKEPFDFRRAALIHPIDTITYLALVLSITDEIEKARVPLSQNRVFSYRFRPGNGILFDSRYNFTSFNNSISEKCNNRRNKILIKSDVANYYDRINLHRLESTLLGIPSINRTRIKIINELLLFWANRDSYGLPIGGNASRILAEAALLSIDEYLLSHKINFCRFVDDYRFFAPDTKTAHMWLTLFIERLFLEGLFINPSKTSLEEIGNRSSVDLKSAKELKTTTLNRTGINRLIVGYTGTVPTKFRELSNREIQELQKENIEELIQDLLNKKINTPKDIRKFLRVLVAKQSYIKLEMIPEILDRFPQFTPIIVDLVIKKFKEIPPGVHGKIQDFFIPKLKESENIPEYILVVIVRLLGVEGYKIKDPLMDLFRKLRRNAGFYIGRCIIDGLIGIIGRNDAIEIRSYFNRADLWEQRAIIRLVDQILPEEEKRPWLKNVKTHMREDLFAIELFDSTKPPQKKKVNGRKV